MPGALQAITVGKTPQRIQTWLAPNESFLLVNNDITNQIFIGNDPGVQAIPVPPLGSISLGNSSHDIWISTGGVAITVQGLLFPSGTQWTPSPAQVAAQINALGLAKEVTQQSGNTLLGTSNSNTGTTASNTGTTATNTGTTVTNTGQTATNVANLTTGGNPGGVPVLRGTDNLGNATAQSLTANTTATLLNAVAISKPSFEAVFSLAITTAAAGTVPFAALLVTWTDSNTGLTVGQKLYEIAAGNGSANPIAVYLSGPCRGNQITLQIRPQDPAQAMTLTWAFNQTSHIYTIDRLTQPVYSGTAPVTYTNPAVTTAIGPNANISRLLAASNAKIKINLDNTVQLNSAAIQINTPSGVLALYGEAAAPTSTFKTTAAAGAQSESEWQLPHGAMVLQVFNQGATNTITPNVTITTMEY